MAKKYYMVLDTETVVDARVPYDVAWVVVDRKGKVHSRFNGLVAEILHNETLRYLVRKDSFAKRKASFYLDDEPAQIMPFRTIAQTALQTIRYYDAIVVAYNAAFDVKVLDNYSQVLRDMPFFDPATEIWDLSNMALNTICDSSNYVRWCIDSGFITEKGNISCSAEAVYSYLTENATFEEDHTALSDCEIEAKILQAVFDRKQKLETAYCSPVFRQRVWKERLKCKK
jgi:DNA polymerase III epsilon subunit-like protein